MKPTSTMPQILQYRDPIVYLQDVLKHRTSVNSRYSLRAWSKELGWKEPTSLSQILNRKRRIPVTVLPRLGKSLKLASAGANYLRAIVYADQAPNDEEKLHWLKGAERIQVRETMDTEIQELASFDFWSDPRLTAIRLATALEDSVNSPEWMAERLRGSVTVDEVRKMVDLLIRSRRLIEAADEKRWVMLGEHLWSKQDLPSQAVRKFHKLSLAAAAVAIESQPLDEREFGSYMLNTRRERIPEMKKRIREFTKEFLSEFDMSEGSDAVYQINLNLFSRTT